jgi:hypothetical protein
MLGVEQKLTPECLTERATDGVDHYGLYPDWIEDRTGLGRAIVEDMANGAEAYLQPWERAEAAASPQ